MSTSFARDPLLSSSLLDFDSMLSDFLDTENISSKSSETGPFVPKREKPKRPLSAYNLFFRNERQAILKDTPTRAQGKPRRSHGKIGFAELARTVSTKWKAIDADTRAYFDELAAKDKKRYKEEMKLWKEEQDLLKTKKESAAASPAHKDPNMGVASSPVSVVDDDFLAKNMLPTSIEEKTKESSLLPFPGSGTVPLCFSESLPSGPCLPTYTISLNGSLISLSHQGPTIAELAKKLDDESVDLLCSIFSTSTQR